MCLHPTTHSLVKQVHKLLRSSWRLLQLQRLQWCSLRVLVEAVLAQQQVVVGQSRTVTNEVYSKSLLPTSVDSNCSLAAHNGINKFSIKILWATQLPSSQQQGVT
jgi:hypothetical protein